ncbi:Ferric-chelate reductase (NAD(P)H) [uncultured archaeon]|nr:Ferric-chelate reductase (NAD(P)H) [uncultured archaeon]
MEKLYHLLYPMRVLLISSSHAGKDNIMPAAWVFPLSFDPPLFGAAISKKRFSYSLIHDSKAYAINTVASGMEKGMWLCGSKTGKDMDKFKEAGWKKENGKKTVLIADAPVSIECEVVDEYAAGDHIIFVGKAINVVKRREAKGLYHRGGEELEAI